MANIGRAYLAGPCNSGNLGLAVNKRNAELMTVLAAKMGYIPFNPITNFAELPEAGVSERQILLMCIREVGNCDVLLLAPNWFISPGAHIEAQFTRCSKTHRPIVHIGIEDLNKHNVEGYVHIPMKELPEIMRTSYNEIIHWNELQFGNMID